MINNILIKAVTGLLALLIFAAMAGVTAYFVGMVVVMIKEILDKD